MLLAFAGFGVVFLFCEHAHHGHEAIWRTRAANENAWRR